MKQWTVIGAGPAGIAAIGKLLDQGIHETDILWIDPDFSVGDFGQKWMSVPGNTPVKFFTDYLNDCRSFHYQENKENYTLDQLLESETCLLKYVTHPLSDITTDLLNRVSNIRCHITHMYMCDRAWQMTSDKGDKITSRNVILATGATPNSLQNKHLTEIPLSDALNPEKLLHQANKNDSIAVYGSSHSAILVIKNLCELGLKQVINIYNKPLSFATPMDGWTLFDNTGLKGSAAKWARENILGHLPSNLIRVSLHSEEEAQYLAQCNKAVYAIGFSNRAPTIKGVHPHEYNKHNGILAPGLFGFGIGFPEQVTDPYGNIELNVGLYKFMKYINKALPVWLRYAP